jgi:hypothetical protein
MALNADFSSLLSHSRKTIDMESPEAIAPVRKCHEGRVIPPCLLLGCSENGPSLKMRVHSSRKKRSAISRQSIGHKLSHR